MSSYRHRIGKRRQAQASLHRDRTATA